MAKHRHLTDSQGSRDGAFGVHTAPGSPNPHQETADSNGKVMAETLTKTFKMPQQVLVGGQSYGSRP